MNPIISVIVPVYNVEKYITKCIDSILAQSFSDFELLLVDDGSTDSSGSICDEYSKKDSRVRVIHKENSGPSDARNMGIAQATGDYVTYIDSDDLVHVDYLELLYNSLKENDAEISVCNIVHFHNEEEIDINSKFNPTIQVMDGEEAMIQMLIGNIHGSSACAMLVPIAMAREINFPSGRYHEDDFISYKYIYSAKKVANIEEALYFYYQRENSIMHSGYGKISVDELDAADYVYSECEKYGKKFQQAAVIKKFFNYYQVLVENSNLKELDIYQYKRVISGLKEMKGPMLFSPYSRRKMKVAALMLYVGGPGLLAAVARKMS